jgi:hypothetical protein
VSVWREDAHKWLEGGWGVLRKNGTNFPPYKTKPKPSLGKEVISK